MNQTQPSPRSFRGGALALWLLVSAVVVVAVAPHPVAAVPAPGYRVDGKWTWQQVLKAGPENGEGVSGPAVSFADRFTGTTDGYPYFPPAVASAGVTTCSVAAGSTNLFVEASGSGAPCGGTSDDIGTNGVADWYIGVAYVVIPASATSAEFLIGTATKTNEVHGMVGAPGAAVYGNGGYSSGSTTYSFSATLSGLATAAGGAKVAELRIYAYDPTAGSGVSVQWKLSGGSFTTIPAANVSTPAEFIPYTVTVTPPAAQTIAYGDAPNLTPTSTGFVDDNDWSAPPTCAVYNGDTPVDTAPVPVGSYTVKCGGGTLPSFTPTKYYADYTATSSLIVTDSETVVVTVTPESSQTITYGDDPDLSPTYDSDAAWAPEPTCKVYLGGSEVSAPYPVGTYAIKCAGGALPPGYVADLTATGTLTVEPATTTINYSGTSGVVSTGPIMLLATLTNEVCSTDGLVFTVNDVVVEDPSALFDVTDGELYEIEVSYSDPNCEAESVYAVVLVGGAASASSGGGHYNVSGVGRVNVGYTVQINKSRNGSTQVSGQLVWNSQNGKFRFKGAILGFVKTDSNCPAGAVCGRIVGTGTLRTNESGEWVVVGTGLSYRASVVDAGTASVCTGSAKKKTCTTVNKTDSFGLDVAEPVFTGEQTVASTGWPTAIQLSGGNILIK